MWHVDMSSTIELTVTADGELFVSRMAPPSHCVEVVD
jgi:hypothetical protein